MSGAALVLEVNNRALVDLLGSWGAWTVTVGGQRRIPYFQSPYTGGVMNHSDLYIDSDGKLRLGDGYVLRVVRFCGYFGFATTYAVPRVKP